MSDHTRSRTDAERCRTDSLALALAVVGVLSLVWVAAGTATAAPASDVSATDSPTVTNASMTASGSNLTVRVDIANATEVDIRNVPGEWTVVTHHDDFGSYVDQLDGQNRLVWLWSVPVSANVSVTFSVPEGTDPTEQTLVIVPYDGTTKGTKAVLGSWTTPGTRTATPKPTFTAVSTDGDADTGTATSDREADTTSGDGPGFGLVAAVIALLVTAAMFVRR